MQIHLYGSLGERIGRAAEVDLPQGGCAVASLRQMLAEAHPDAAEELLRPSLRACVNDVIVGEEFIVQPGASLEFFPPLSGG